MDLHEKVLQFLIKDERFRERKNKNKGICILLAEIHPQIILPVRITLDVMAEVVKDYATMDRHWRQILEEKKELRGSDYDEKEKLEKNKKEELGYNVKKEVVTNNQYKD